jgi:hypothetical protein
MCSHGKVGRAKESNVEGEGKREHVSLRGEWERGKEDETERPNSPLYTGLTPAIITLFHSSDINPFIRADSSGSSDMFQLLILL